MDTRSDIREFLISRRAPLGRPARERVRPIVGQILDSLTDAPA